MTEISTPDVDVVRRAYAALAAGDIHQLEQCFARDAVWHEPGSNIYSGDRVGWPEIRDEFLALLGPLSHGTLRTELVGISVSERYVVAVHRATGEHNGLTLDSTKLRGSSRGPGSSPGGLGFPRQANRGRCVLDLRASAALKW
jgi:uncharacterized protein